MKKLCHKATYPGSRAALCGIVLPKLGDGGKLVWRVNKSSLKKIMGERNTWPFTNRSKKAEELKGVIACPKCLELEPLQLLGEQDL